MSLQPFLPLLAAICLGLPILLAVEIDRLDRILKRLGVVSFGTYVDHVGRRKTERRELLRAAHVPITYRAYAATTILYATVGALVGGILGLYVIWGVLRVLAVDETTMRRLLPTAFEYLATFAGLGTLTPGQLLSMLLVSGLTFGLFAGLLTYWFRWWWPEHLAATRERTIDGTMPQTIAFMYALSRSGMSFPQTLRIMADHRRIYGAAAAEVGVAVRYMDLFGRDMITAIREMGRRTPSEQFEEFSENLASVLQSGRSRAAFLEEQYDDFQEEAEAQQERILELLSTLAEGYVTLFVAGPLFLITLLVIIGIAGADTLTALQVFVYFLLPIGNLGFVLYLDAVTERFGRSERVGELPSISAHINDVRRAAGSTETADGEDPVTDGGAASGSFDDATRADFDEESEAGRRHANLERLALHQQLEWLRSRLGSPVRTVVKRPVTLLYVTVPLAIAVTALRLWLAPELTIHVVDDVLVQATLFVVGSFAVAFELHRRRIRTIEAAVPDFLDRLASVNEAGLSVVDSVGRVRGSDLGALDPEVDRIWHDVQWGADLETALLRFERRVRTRTISRVVALVTNAMHASGDVARVLRIAAAQAKADRRLRQRRRQEMLSYVVVVYVSFFVFLVIVGALDAVLIPNLPESSIVPEPDGSAQQAVPGGVGALDGLGEIDTDAFRLLFFHTALLQALLSGVVAGQMSTGDVRNGAKHATVLLLIAYVAFLVL